MRILVTGCLGFIGSQFVKRVLAVAPSAQVTGFARNSDLRNLHRLDDATWGDARFHFIYGDLTDANALSGICESIDVVVNFAAKTFVDHSLKDDRPFLESNIIGAMNLMQDARRYNVKRFVQVSTDEVYGQILTGAYREDATLNPRNPYAWSKAAADLYAIQLHRTHGFPVIITRTENNFGPWQHRQKVLPTFVRAALAGELLPVYGDGLHVRCWLHVEEHCRAIWHLITKSLNNGTLAESYQNLADIAGSKYNLHDEMLGEVYHVAGEDELTNIDLAHLVLGTLGKSPDQIRYVPDHNVRPGHDRRYALDCGKLRATGFEIKQNVRERLAEVIQWYAEHEEWTR